MLGKRICWVLAIAGAVALIGSPYAGLAQSGQPANVGNVSSEDFGDAFVAAAIGMGGVRANDGPAQVEAVRAMKKGTGSVSRKSQIVVQPSIFEEAPRLIMIDGPIKIMPLRRESAQEKLEREAEEAYREAIEQHNQDWWRRSSDPLDSIFKQARHAAARKAAATSGAPGGVDIQGH